jgi:hypothetical protein
MLEARKKELSCVVIATPRFQRKALDKSQTKILTPHAAIDKASCHFTASLVDSLTIHMFCYQHQNVGFKAMVPWTPTVGY